MGELKNLFKPEFLNRIDDIIVFHKLSKENTVEIAGKMLQTLREKLREMEITVSFTDAVVAAIAEKGYDTAYGARPLRRVIQNQIEDKISEEMLEGKMLAGKTYLIDTQESQFIIHEAE